MSGARTATATTNVMPARPATAARRRTSRRARPRRPGAVGPAATEAAPASSWLDATRSLGVCMAKPRVEHRVDEVDGEVDEDEADRRDEDAALDHREVAPGEGVER